MVLRIIRRLGFPYGDFRVFLAIEKDKKIFIIKRNNKIVLRTKDSKVETKREVFKKARDLELRSVRI